VCSVLSTETMKAGRARLAAVGRHRPPRDTGRAVWGTSRGRPSAGPDDAPEGGVDHVVERGGRPGDGGRGAEAEGEHEFGVPQGALCRKSGTSSQLVASCSLTHCTESACRARDSSFVRVAAR
jgi:hypothetical protein